MMDSSGASADLALVLYLDVHGQSEEQNSANPKEDGDGDAHHGTPPDLPKSVYLPRSISTVIPVTFPLPCILLQTSIFFLRT
jgi:hypothetical protein